jgi:hypothetical protein
MSFPEEIAMNSRRSFYNIRWWHCSWFLTKQESKTRKFANQIPGFRDKLRKHRNKPPCVKHFSPFSSAGALCDSLQICGDHSTATNGQSAFIEASPFEQTKGSLFEFTVQKTIKLTYIVWTKRTAFALRMHRLSETGDWACTNSHLHVYGVNRSSVLLLHRGCQAFVALFIHRRCHKLCLK